MPLQVDRPADLAAFVGTELQSEAFALTQSDIDRFVALSGDPQWIHPMSRGLGRRPGGSHDPRVAILTSVRDVVD
jgi:hypothetical protein